MRVGLGAAGRGLSCGIGRVGSGTVCAAGELGEVTFVVMGIESLGFFEGVEVRDVVELFVEDLLLCETIRLCGLEDLSST